MSFDQPKVSIVVAARNEELYIKDCITSLLNQDYPSDCLEVWIGNDNSDDETGSIILSFLQNSPNIHYLEITSCLGHLKGKANVLAQLIKKTSGEIILITDADGIVPPTWVRRMVESFSQNIDIVTGVTAIKGTSLFSRLQNAEWLFYIGNGHSSSEKGKPITAIGNNMAVRKSKYESIGGYENIPFSITEDYELFRQIVKAGGCFKTVYEKEALIFTYPIQNLYKFFHQRKRWLKGAFQLPIKFSAGLLFLWLLLPIFLFTGAAFGWRIAFALFALKWGLDLVFMNRFYRQVGIKKDIGYFLYTPYSLIFNLLILIFYLIPSPVIWKGRSYS